MDNHISCQPANVGVIRQLWNLRCINLSIINIIKKGWKLLFIIWLDFVSIFDRLWMSMLHISTVWHHLILPTYLRNIQVCHIIKLLLRDWVLTHLIIFNHIWCLDSMLIIVVVLIAYANFLMIVTISRLTLLISDKRHTMNARNTALSIYYLLVLLLINIEVTTCMQVKLFFGIQCIEVLKIGWIKCIFETLLKSANYIEVLLVITNLLRTMLAFLLSVLLIVKIDDLWVTLLRW